VVLTTHYLEEAETLCERIAMLKQGRLVALDSTRNLLSRRHDHQAQLRLDGEPPASLGLRHGQGRCWLFGFQDYAELETLLAGLRTAGIKVLEMQLLEPDLEDVFTEIIQNA
jgi:ABC-2 type transport system ATP-binding protein